MDHSHHHHLTELSSLAFFIMGLSGSFHCAFMCAPLTCLIFKEKTSVKQLLLYHVSRILSYAFLAYLAKALLVKMFPKFLTQISFVFLLLFGLFFLFDLSLPKSVEETLNKKTLQLFQKLKFHRYYLMGFLTPLLPCGLLYSALFASQTASSSKEAAIFAFSFGLGTVFMLLLTQILMIRGMLMKNRKSFKLISKLGALVMLLFLIYAQIYLH